jgi:predicted HTH domain antitoxin
MALTIQLPDDIERDLRRDLGNLDQAAKEAMLIELYRQDNVSQHQLSQALGLDRFETEALLKKHNVTEDLPTDEEYDAALARLGVLQTK